METEVSKSQGKRMEHQAKVGGDIATVSTSQPKVNTPHDTVASLTLAQPALLDANVMAAIQATVQEQYLIPLHHRFQCVTLALQMLMQLCQMVIM